jgi:hypothetical protein
MIINSGRLSLKLGANTVGRDSIGFICEGIVAARALSRLTVEVVEAPGLNEKRFAPRILDAVVQCSSLRHFEGNFPMWNSVDDKGPNMEAFLSSNVALEHFAFAPFSLSVEGRTDIARGVRHRAVASAANGLCHNQRLQAIDFAPGRHNSFPVGKKISGKIVAMLEGRNTSLKRIDGLVYLHRQHEARINSLLELNRYGQEFAENFRTVPVGVWSDVLCRISNVDCNFVVTRLVRGALEPQGPLSGAPREGAAAARPGARAAAPKDAAEPPEAVQESEKK